MRVRVHRGREPHRLAEGAQQGEVAGGIFLAAERGREDGPRRVVDGPQEAAGGLRRPEPRVGAPVELEEEPGLGFARPAAPMLGGPTAARRDHPGGPQDPADRGATDRQALHRGELLGEVVVIEPRVPSLGEGNDLRAESVREPPGRPAPAIPMGEALRPSPLERPPEPPHLARGES